MKNISRRSFLKYSGVGATVCLSTGFFSVCNTASKKPNIILCMSDDQGWGDTGYNGHPVLKTPNLDAMAANGVQFTRFYSAAPVCSPTRGSCMTGRHPYRYGVFFANAGHMNKQEITLAEALKILGYTTGHFGKWHLGTLTATEQDANRGEPGKTEHYAPPWEHGFDVCFSTESKVPTWDPMITPDPSSGNIGNRIPGKPFGTAYWSETGQKVTENVSGNDSRLIMDRAIPFIRNAAERQQPFLTVIWFHAPHLPVIAGEKYRKLYADRSVDEQHFFGCITAMDEQIGRLRDELRRLNIADNTMLWFCSDNGPEGKTRGGRTQGTTRGLRGRKRSLFEGGIRVPGLLVWPERVPGSKKIDMPCCTSDYFPTIMNALGHSIKGQPQPLDGINLLPAIDGEKTDRPAPVCFESRNQVAVIDNRYKLISQDKGRSFMLFDLLNDPAESLDISAQHPDLVKKYTSILHDWRESCKNSLKGFDYK